MLPACNMKRKPCKSNKLACLSLWFSLCQDARCVLKHVRLDRV